MALFQRQISPEMEQQMKSSYIEGSTAKQVARDFGVSYRTVFTYAGKRWKTKKRPGMRPEVVCIRCTCRMAAKHRRYCAECIRESRRTGGPRPSGANHPAWKGGGAQRSRFTSEYKAWRKSVFQRDHYTCQMCAKRGGTLNADHIIPYSVMPSLRLSLENGRTLCADCHRKTPTYGCGAKKFLIETTHAEAHAHPVA